MLSIKTGACPEDCAYCPQSIRFETAIDRHDLMSLDAVRAAAQRAKDAGATRFCMGASYRGPKDRSSSIIEMVKAVKAVGLETCATSGLLRPDRPSASPKPASITTTTIWIRRPSSTRRSSARAGTRTARDARARSRGRRQSLLRRHRRHGRDARGPNRHAAHARDAGSTTRKRADQRLVPSRARRSPSARRSTRSSRAVHRRRKDPDAAVERAAVRGPQRLQRRAAGALLFAGANSIFYGEKLLTTGNPDTAADQRLFERLGLAAEEGARRVSNACRLGKPKCP